LSVVMFGQRLQKLTFDIGRHDAIGNAGSFKQLDLRVAVESGHAVSAS